jgi:hypothetical protein
VFCRVEEAVKWLTTTGTSVQCRAAAAPDFRHDRRAVVNERTIFVTSTVRSLPEVPWRSAPAEDSGPATQWRDAGFD